MRPHGSKIGIFENKILKDETNLNFNFTFPPGFVAQRAVSPSLDKIPCSCTASQLEVCGQCILLCDCQFRIWFRKGGSSS